MSPERHSAPLGERPLAAFDLETTGPNPLTDRVVTANLTTIATDPNGVTEIKGRNWLLNPEIDIPEGASAVHGITTEHAREHGMDYELGLAEIRSALEDAWFSGSAVVAFNAAFDLTMMHHESLRVGFDGLDIDGPVIDPFVIDKAFDQYRKGKRTLGVVCGHYGVKLDNAHEAEADAVAAARLAWVMLRRYGLHTATHEQIMREQAGWYREQADGLARFWRKKAMSLSGDERAQLLEQAATIRTEWPVAAPPADEEFVA
ncbi:MAG: 3'-5' exonuclease [Rhodococcus sp. (in: high G+C Gram-positive bacteria)]|nr:MAG: 3'-5' exonuclease [Rhodococcus sp. (in: high G+C Gram-positive bacteria)]